MSSRMFAVVMLTLMTTLMVAQCTYFMRREERLKAACVERGGEWLDQYGTGQCVAKGTLR